MEKPVVLEMQMNADTFETKKSDYTKSTKDTNMRTESNVKNGTGSAKTANNLSS